MSKLAAMVDIPAATLRSVQLGRRTFNPELQRRMRRRGFHWEPKSNHWLFTFGHETPLSLQLLESLRRLSTRGSLHLQDCDARALAERAIALLRNVEPASYRSLLLDLHDSLESLRETYKVEGAEEVFRETTVWYKVMENDSGGYRLAKGYNWRNLPKRMLDLSDKWQLSPINSDADDQSESSGAITQPAA